MTSRTLSITSAAIPLFMGEPALEPVRLSGREGMNSLFEYELLLKTPDALNLVASEAADFDLNAFVGREISCTIALDGMGAFVAGAVGASVDAIGAGERQINAVIEEAAFVGEEGRHLLYRLTLRPWLYRATLNLDSRILQNKTVIDILDDLLAAYPFPVDKRLIETYPERDYQTQYNESDFDFFSRLCQEWGINYHFEHSEGTHRLVLTDAMGAYQPNPSAAYHRVDYHPPGWKTEAEYLHGFVPLSRLTSGAYATRDQDYTRPKADLHIERRDPRPTGLADAEVYAWHANAGGSHYAQPRAGRAEPNDPQAEGRLLAGLRMQALRTAGARAQARGNLRGMEAGCTFQLHNHPRRTANTDYLILDTRFLIEDVAQDSQIKDAGPGRRQQWRVEVELTVHPMTEALRPALTQPKPYSGPQSALVVGPHADSSSDGKAANQWVDQLGRIKVQFPWDRHGKKNQHSSCWVRVVGAWAGNQLGGIHLPRVGQEVVVDFIGGDMDLPICMGRTHNALNQPPWELPGQAALSGFRSRELTPEGGNSAAGRSNHLVMDDTAGQIQAQLKSDHQSSSLSLGHITRVAGHAGRQAEAGDGAELRTDGHAVIRAQQGALLTTEKADARGPMKAMAETLERLGRARERHERGADAAMQARAQEMGDQDQVAEALKRQNEEIGGTGARAGSSGDNESDHRFPELSQPHLVLASPAGIETSTAGSTHIASEGHTAITSGGHTSVMSEASLLVTVMQSIRMAALEQGMTLVAAKADIEIQALSASLNMLAKKEITLRAEVITLEALKEVRIGGGGSYRVWREDGIEDATAGAYVNRAGGHGFVGPKSVPVSDFLFPASTGFCKECMLAALASGSAFAMP